MSEEFHSDLQTMKREMDALQIEVMKGKGPWYKSPPIIISALALMFSFGTTAVSSYKASQEEVRSARAELRGILQRLSSLPKENYELLQKYSDAEGQSLTGFLNQENSLLAGQASEIVDRYPDDISASEYAAVAYALMISGDVSKVPRYLERAIDRSSDPNVELAALRTYGGFLLNSGQPSDGRRRYEEALNVWDRYPDVTDYFKQSNDAFTETYWAQNELFAENVEEARKHLRRAQDRALTLTDAPVTRQVLGQINYTMALIDRHAATSQRPFSGPLQ